MLATQLGYRVTGCDENVYPPMSKQLEGLGIELINGWNADQVKLNPDVFVIGNVITRGNPLMERILNDNLNFLSGPQWLSEYVLKNKWVLGVAGTHGKTTTASMLAWLMEFAELKPGFLIGGLPHNFGVSARITDSPFFVIEADEYDTAYFDKRSKFIHYKSRTTILNNLEFDHADIFSELADIIRSFQYLVNTVPGSGLIVANSDDKSVKEVIKSSHTPVQTFGLESNAYWQGYEIKTTTTGTNFKVLREQKNYGDFWIPLHGVFNVRNAIAAIAVGNSAGIGENEIKNGLATFKGVKRRQEILGVWNNIVVIDDFAHHPTAVENTLVAIREAYSQHRLWALFEPASSTNSRAIFEDDYFRALSIASNIVVGQVPRPERARMDTPFVPNRLVEKLKEIGKYAWHFDHSDQICTHLSKNTQSGDVVVFLSNGGFSGIQQAFIKTLKSSHEND